MHKKIKILLLLLPCAVMVGVFIGLIIQYGITFHEINKNTIPFQNKTLLDQLKPELREGITFRETQYLVTPEGKNNKGVIGRYIPYIQIGRAHV